MNIVKIEPSGKISTIQYYQLYKANFFCSTDYEGILLIFIRILRKVHT